MSATENRKYGSIFINLNGVNFGRQIFRALDRSDKFLRISDMSSCPDGILFILNQCCLVNVE